MRLIASVTVWIVLFVMTTPLSTQEAGSPSVDVFAPATDLSFAISTDRSSYSAKGLAIDVKYRIANVGKAAVWVPRDPWAFKGTVCADPELRPRINAWLEDRDGHSYRMGFGYSCGSTPGAPPPTVADVLGRTATRMEPGAQIDGVLQVQLMPRPFTPGLYRVVATISGWASAFPPAELSKLGTRILHGDIRATQDVPLTP